MTTCTQYTHVRIAILVLNLNLSIYIEFCGHFFGIPFSIHKRIQTLEAALNGKEKDLQEEKAKFSKLKEDFKYNLKVLEERDQELERYDVTFSGNDDVLN